MLITPVFTHLHQLTDLTLHNGITLYNVGHTKVINAISFCLTIKQLILCC